jgi:uncharacterized protein (TIGR02246 family)
MTKLTRLLVIVFLVLSPTGAAFPAPADEASTVIDHWAAAYSANDADAVVKLYAPDAILLGTVSPILSEGTEAIRAYFARLPGSGNKVVIGERRTVALGDDAVLATGFYEFTRLQDGNPVPTPARFTMVVVNRGGEWVILHHHSSMRPKPPQ